jgi:hypothetical protein
VVAATAIDGSDRLDSVYGREASRREEDHIRTSTVRLEHYHES